MDCPWCGNAKARKRNLTCGRPNCKALQAKSSRQKKNIPLGALYEPWGSPRPIKKEKPWGAKGPKGGLAVELCASCAQIIEGRCRIFSGNLNARFMFGRECGLKEWKI